MSVEIRGDGTPGGRLVLMDGVEASHVDLVDPTRLEFEYLRHLAGAVDTISPPSHRLCVLQVGGGPCTFARWLTATRRRARITVVERDAGLMRIAEEWLALETSDRLRVATGDGREEIRRSPDAAFDVVVIDAFVGRAVPLHLMTGEFLDEVRRVLRPGGLHVVNLIDEPPLAYAEACAATLLSRFHTVLVMADPRVLARRSAGNLVLVASDGQLPVEQITRRISRDPVPWGVRWGRAVGRMAARASVLTDDLAESQLTTMIGPLGNRRHD